MHRHQLHGLNFIVNFLSAIAAYCFFPKKPPVDIAFVKIHNGSVFRDSVPLQNCLMDENMRQSKFLIASTSLLRKEY